MKTWIFSLLLLSLLLLLGCAQRPNQQANSPAALPPQSETSSHTAAAEPVPSSEPTSERYPEDPYGIKVNDTILLLRDWDDQLDLLQLLGTPLSENVEVVQGDGLTGSLLKKLTYDGLALELFSPKGNEKTFWIMTMTLDKSTYATKEGLKVGDTVAELKSVYPDATTGETDANNAEYERRITFDFMRFVVKDGLIAQIKIFYLIP